MPRRVFSIMDQSIGQPASTFTLQLAQALAQQSYRVVVLDANPQAYITRALDLEHDGVHGLAQALLEDVPLEQLMLPITDYLHIVPAGQKLTDFDRVEVGGLQRAKRLKQILEQPIMKEQDFIFIVAPKEQGLLMINALHAANEVIAPTSGHFASLQNTIQGIRAFRRVESVVGNATKFWLVLEQIKETSSVFEQIKGRVLSLFPTRVFKTILMETPQSKQQEIDLLGQTSMDFAALAKDVVSGRTY